VKTLVTDAAQTRKPLRFRGRSFLALVLAPEPPLDEWLVELDEWNKRSPGFFRGRPVVLDLCALSLDKEGVAQLIGDLSERDIRLMGVEGTKSSWLGLGMPPLISGGRETEIATPESVARESRGGGEREEPVEKPVSGSSGAVARATALTASETASLVVDKPVRSGQSIIFPQGDVTIVGSVASGAEVIAGGSIHVYGALRGRAIAGSMGNPSARIFCGKLEAELLAIDGLYRTADDMEPEFRGRPVQTWLEGDAVRMTALN
jgi:septum site-determining protein MinC